MTLPSQVSPPEFALIEVTPGRVSDVTTVALPVLTGAEGPELGPGAVELADDLGLDLLEVLESAQATGRAGQITDLPVLDAPGAASAGLRLVLLVGVGAGTPHELRRAGAALARRTRDQDAVASSVAAVGDDEGMEAFVEGAVLGSFVFSIRRDGPEHRPVRRIVLACTPDTTQTASALRRALARAGASWSARLLATVPSNIKNPAWLAEQVLARAEEAGLKAKVWDEHKLAKVGFGGVLAVGRASATPPRLVQLDYRPSRGGRKARHVVLVGKGITFDSGGLSIKPAASMVSMKRDMTGAAVVAAAMTALAEVDCPVRVTALLPLAENAIGGDAMRPGDVIRHFGGRTTEVRNTDAEGRLVLADALAYAAAELEPDVIVDVATLTGGIKVALGQHVGGLFANHDGLAESLRAAGERAGEPVWRMPLAAEYEPKIASKIADGDNAPGGPPAITAALFLQHFVGGLPWAHLDIASVGDAPKDDFEWTEGPTGFGVRLLLRWLGQAAPLAEWEKN